MVNKQTNKQQQKKTCAFFVVLKLVRPRLQSVFSFSAAKPGLGLLTFSLLGPMSAPQLKDPIEKGMVFCPGAPGPLSGPPLWGSRAHVCESEHLWPGDWAHLIWALPFGCRSALGLPGTCLGQRRGACWGAERTVCPQGCCCVALVSESGWQPHSPPIPLIHPSPIPPSATSVFLFLPCCF